MTNLDLINWLQRFPPGVKVCVLDWRKNLHHASSEGTSEGLYEFEDMDVCFDPNVGFITVSIDNDDYLDNGDPNKFSSLAESVRI